MTTNAIVTTLLSICMLSPVIVIVSYILPACINIVVNSNNMLI